MCEAELSRCSRRMFLVLVHSAKHVPLCLSVPSAGELRIVSIGVDGLLRILLHLRLIASDHQVPCRCMPAY